METFSAAKPNQARIGLLAGMLALAAPAAMAQGFCGNYVQVSSNAGACPQCTLFIADNPEIQKYFAEANTG